MSAIILVIYYCGENYWSATSHWQTLSNNIVL